MSYPNIPQNALQKGNRIPIEYSRLITAAVVNERFRKLLLTNPEMALSMGYSGEKFNLSVEEKKRLTSIKANSIEDFASQIANNNKTRSQSNSQPCYLFR